MQYMTDGDGGLADYFEFNVDLLGQVLKKEDRASEIISGIEGILSDLRGISGTSDQNVYIAGVTISGSNTLNTTSPCTYRSTSPAPPTHTRAPRRTRSS